MRDEVGYWFQSTIPKQGRILLNNLENATTYQNESWNQRNINYEEALKTSTQTVLCVTPSFQY